MSKTVTLRRTKTKNRIPLWNMYLIGAFFIFFVVAIFLAEMNMSYTIRPESLELLPKEELIAAKSRMLADKAAGQKDEKNCLVIYESDEVGMAAIGVIEPVLDQMKEPYRLCSAEDVNKADIAGYRKVVLAVTHYQLLSQRLEDIRNFVGDGGNLMVFYPPEGDGSFGALSDIMGIKEYGNFVLVDGIHFPRDFMIGGTAHDFPVTDPYTSSMGVSLRSDCEVFMESTGENPVPLIWRQKTGEGSVVFDNLGFMEKSYRGIHAAAYSLLGDYCIYPVINGSVFYIDDFPSPVPEGDATYITRDYNMSIDNFYTQVWWNDVYNLAKEYGIQYTGLVIENYSDQVSGAFERNPEIGRYKYFGNMLLKSGGEIGTHGYNHMPLVPASFDYHGDYDTYTQWPTESDMKNSVEEVMAFTKELFPDEEINTYVPPSNIFSAEGRKVLDEKGYRTVAAIYLPGDLAYEQEFSVSAEDGIVDTPRVISGYVLNDYMQLVALSELSFHLVSSHFQHPDDVLDEDRGAQQGWEALFNNYENYVKWLYKSIPQIRNLTGSEMAAAVQNYDIAGVNRSYGDGMVKLEIENFHEELWMLLRLNSNQMIDTITGGEYSRVAENLYLIRCMDENVEIKLK